MTLRNTPQFDYAVEVARNADPDLGPGDIEAAWFEAWDYFRMTPSGEEKTLKDQDSILKMFAGFMNTWRPSAREAWDACVASMRDAMEQWLYEND